MVGWRLFLRWNSANAAISGQGPACYGFEKTRPHISAERPTISCLAQSLQVHTGQYLKLGHRVVEIYLHSTIRLNGVVLN
jgi:hypothetical protein